MNEKIMLLIREASMFNGKRTASVEFSSNINGIIVCVSDQDEKGLIYRKVCYLDWGGAEQRLNTMLGELEELHIKIA